MGRATVPRHHSAGRGRLPGDLFLPLRAVQHFLRRPDPGLESVRRLARSISGGAWISRQVFYFPPLYPYLLGLLFKAFGHSLAVVYLFQALLGLVNLLLVYRVGIATFNERVGLWAAGAAALYGPFAFFEMKVLGTTLGLTLNLLALALLLGAERAALAGRPGVGRC